MVLCSPTTSPPTSATTATTTSVAYGPARDLIISGIPARKLDGRKGKIMKLILILLTSCLEFSVTAHELPDTGQVACYDGAGAVIACPAPGNALAQDGSYQPATAQPSYTDNGNGTTTDNKTGLVWVKDGASAACNNGASLTWEAALNFCEALNFAGYSDWRLPNRRELISIVDYSKSSPAINDTFFPNTGVGLYWTSTTYLPNSAGAWRVSSDGIVNYGGLSSGNVRCVRAGP